MCELTYTLLEIKTQREMLRKRNVNLRFSGGHYTLHVLNNNIPNASEEVEKYWVTECC